jgi:uncharacterized protein YkwD
MANRRISGLVAGVLAASMSVVCSAHVGRAATIEGTRVHVSWARQMLRLVNEDRSAAGLAPLKMERDLTIAARSHSEDMARHAYFAHEAPNGTSPFQRMHAAGVRYTWAGENLGEDEYGSPVSMLQQINTAMMNSTDHRANLLRTTFTAIGISVVFTGPQVYVTEDFAG